MAVAAIFPVGTTVGGCPDAIGEILKTETSLAIYLLYGNRGSPDANDPKDSVEQIQNAIRDPRITWEECRAVEPYEFSETYGQIREFMAHVAERRYDRVYVGITGGTNPMNASLFQTAMAYLPSQVVPMYVQAKGSAWQRSFVASDVRDRVTAEEALGAARSGQVRIAARLAERLPSDGPWKFLRSSLNALSYWDDFDYSQARQPLEHQARKSQAYVVRPLLAPLAETVVRIAASAGQMSAIAGEIRDQQNFNVAAANPGWPQRVSKIGLLLVADALANAERRMVEGRFTDSVQRSYRAAECATQMRLLAIGIHPSRPDACENAYCRFAFAKQQGGSQIAFRAGLELLQWSGLVALEPIDEPVRNLASTRNHTYLEHGYDRVQHDQAQRCFEWSLAICENLLGPDIRREWRSFQMQF